MQVLLLNLLSHSFPTRNLHLFGHFHPSSGVIGLNDLPSEPTMCIRHFKIISITTIDLQHFHIKLANDLLSKLVIETAPLGLRGLETSALRPFLNPQSPLCLISKLYIDNMLS